MPRPEPKKSRGQTKTKAQTLAKETRYGIWNGMQKKFQFNINEASKNAALRALHDVIGHDAKKWRFEPRKLPEA
ncbi:hypothetical protein D3C85_703800 [compost metagenome]